MTEWDAKDDHYRRACERVCVSEYYIRIDVSVSAIGIVACDGNRSSVGAVYR